MIYLSFLLDTFKALAGHFTELTSMLIFNSKYIFYRATLCIARTAVARCLSVCVSDTIRYDIVYLTCSRPKKLTYSQRLPYGTN